MRRLIFVHGINNEVRTKEEIESTWSASLKSAIGPRADSWWDQVEIRTAYYGTTLAEETTNWERIQPAGARMSADSPPEDFADPEIAALYLAIQRGRNIPDELVAQELDPADDRAAVPMAAGVHKGWLKAIARTLEKLVPSAADGLAERFLGQAATYLRKPGTYDLINDMVREQVFLNLDPLDRTVVVGHSLGTIVTFVLLREMIVSGTMPLYVTLGSPLGIDVVKNRVGVPRIRPPVVDRWVNGADPEDFVALKPALNADSFGQAEITNYGHLDNGYSDAHSALKYLGHPEIADAIYGALK